MEIEYEAYINAINEDNYIYVRYGNTKLFYLTLNDSINDEFTTDGTTILRQAAYKLSVNGSYGITVSCRFKITQITDSFGRVYYSGL